MLLMNNQKVKAKQKRNSSSKLDYDSFINDSRALKYLKSLKESGSFKAHPSRYSKIVRRIRFFRSRSGARFLNKLVLYIKFVHEVKLEIDTIYNYVSYMEHLMVHHGYDRAAKILKDVASYGLRFSVGHKSPKVQYVSTLEKSDIPKILKGFIDNLSGSRDQVHAALTILDLHRLYGIGSSIPSVEGIIKEGVIPRDPSPLISSQPGRYFSRLYDYTGDPFWITVRKAWIKTLEEAFPSKHALDRLDALRNLSTIHISTKSGPNGPLCPSAVLDFIAISQSKTKDGSTLLEKIQEISSMTYNYSLNSLIKYFKDKMDSTGYDIGYYSTRENAYTGKLSIKYEHSGKSRFIAICDFFSQSALKGMHEFDFQWLSKQKEDGTKDQNRSFQVAQYLTLSGKDVDSQDLTEATNGFSSDLQSEKVEKQFSNSLGLLWNTISTDREFYSPDLDSYIRYSVGQPMGLYSSWSNLAVGNHLLARTACLLSKLPWKKRVVFQICGDDFFGVTDNGFSKVYAKIIDGIGIGISASKGYTQDTIDFERCNSPPKVIEFVKRVSMNGYEYTPVRPQIIYLGLTQPSNFNTLLDTIYNKGIFLSPIIIAKIASLTYNFKASMQWSLSPIAPCKYVSDYFYDFSLGYHENIFEYLKLNVFNIETIPDQVFLDKILSVFENFNFTYTEFFDSYKNYLSNTILNMFLNCLRSAKKFISEWTFLDIEERPGHSFRETKLLSEGLKLLDVILILIYLKSRLTIQEAIDLLGSESIEKVELEKIHLLFRSTYDYFLILKGLRNNDDTVMKEFSRKLHDVMKEFNSINSSVDYKILTYNQVSFTLSLSEEKGFDKFKSFSKLEGEERESNIAFFNTKEGFLSTLSQETNSAMKYLEEKFGKSFNLGPSLKSQKIKTDLKLSSIILDKLSHYHLDDRDTKLTEFLLNSSVKIEIVNLVNDQNLPNTIARRLRY